MKKVKNPLATLRNNQGKTCYNGYIADMYAGRDRFIEECVRHENFRNESKKRVAYVRKLAGAAYDWWFGRDHHKLLAEVFTKVDALMAWDNNILDEPRVCKEYKKCVSDVLDLLPRMEKALKK